jgi:hypothetical protein
MFHHKIRFIIKKLIENTHTLQLFKEIIKTEGVYKSNENAKLEGLVDETKWSD